MVTKRLAIGPVTICQRCCCGNTANGRPPGPVECQRIVAADSTHDQWPFGPCDTPNVVTISNENGTGWFGGISELKQYRTLLEWAVCSRHAWDLLPLPNEFRGHTPHPSLNATREQTLELSYFKYRFTRSISSSVAWACSVVGLRRGSTTWNRT
jgi:hypothetical protein